jgi:hypothetical protein
LYLFNDFETLNLFWQPFSEFESSGKIGTSVCVCSGGWWGFFKYYLALKFSFLLNARDNHRIYFVVDTNVFIDKIQKLLMVWFILSSINFRSERDQNLKTVKLLGKNCIGSWEWLPRSKHLSHRTYGSRYVGLLHKNALLKQNHILEVWESINEISWTFLCFNWDGTPAIQRQTKDWQKENVITVWEIDESSDLTVSRINNLEWLQKGIKLYKCSV